MARPLRRSEHDKADFLREKFVSAWARTDQIFALIRGQELLDKPIVWRHPFLFYVGHLPAFSWNQVCGAILKWKSFNAYFDDLFCRGVDPDVDTGECHWHPEVPDAWPSLSDTVEYRDNVRDAILESLDALTLSESSDPMAYRGRVFQLVLEHEYMHQETLLYMLQQLPIGKMTRPQLLLRYSYQPAPQCRAIKIPAGKARLGANFEDLDFGWDNEFAQTIVDVPPFAIDSLPVTNGQFFDFIEAGGYEEEHCWWPEDWRWKNLEHKRHPSSWCWLDGHWTYRAMADQFPLEKVASWPVYVSLAEARAYARWCGKRLPTEAEFQRAAYYGPDEHESQYPWGNGGPDRQHGNFDFALWSPAPVGASPAGTSRWGVSEMVGNGWELTDTPFAPLPGFTPYIASYPDYSADFFDGKHFVVKGASWATDAELLRPSFRNWYQAHYPYVFAKFRCVSDS
jgi:ergothioneine biosynthesis protein EgtB